MSETIPPPIIIAPEPTTPPPAHELPWAKPMIAVFTLSTFIIVYALAYRVDDKQTMSLMAGAVIANVTALFGYYFGSSSDSVRKTELAASTNPPKL